MNERSIILVGGPDSGKSNFLARLWLALQSGKLGLVSTTPPDDIKYVEEIASHLHQGKFAPRTEPTDTKRDFHVSVKSTDGIMSAQIHVPDMYGEVWDKAVKTLEISEVWLKMLQASAGAVLFIRVLSPLHLQPLDWVTSQNLLKGQMSINSRDRGIPTQVAMIELFRFLEENLLRENGTLPKIAIVVTAWDLLNEEEAALGPTAYIEKNFPMFAGKIIESANVEVKVFGISIVGGNLDAEDFVEQFLKGNIEDRGYVVVDETKSSENKDITEPIRWILD